MRISDWSSDVCSSDLEFCVGVDLATYEFENVPAKTAEFVASRIPLLPAPIALSVGQDRLRSEVHTSELQSLMRISYAVFCLKKKTLNIISPVTQYYRLITCSP